MSERLRTEMKHQAPDPNRKGLSPASRSLRMLVSRPIAAKAKASRNWFTITSRAVHAAERRPELFTRIIARKPSTHQGTGALPGGLFCVSPAAACLLAARLVA